MEITDKAANLAHETFDNIANATHQAVEALGEKGEQLQNAEQHLMKNCRGYVRDNPISSIGIAVAGGFLLSRLLNNRRKPE
ncbi:DUF883 domain-containing protein [Methylobacter sp. Wu8]|uniref:DUF883 domain-containing protein n=1 Tax=Methylobacter sp. Wu8 TaxID=3118457 RepID=UPI002F30C2C9|nr:DUF883 domain-containing protein [Methylobacter tundripaludum]